MENNINNREKKLFYLNELSNYVVDDKDKDVRGWVVKDGQDRPVGKVDNLLVNKSTERVVYLDVEVDESIINKNFEPYQRDKSSSETHNFINEDGENHIILPIGLANLDIENEVVYSKSVDQDTFAHTKRHQKGTDIEREYEVIIIDTYDRSENKKSYGEDDEFYDNQHFESNY